ncbi:hypothetical protein [Sporosarcina sp. G11-34]|nr:hypothetical protein [Sporosarcina sp. G11-34]
MSGHPLIEWTLLAIERTLDGIAMTLSSFQWTSRNPEREDNHPD